MQKQNTSKTKPRTMEQMQSKLYKEINAAIDKLPPKPMSANEVVKNNIVIVRQALDKGLTMTTVGELIKSAFGISVSARAIKRVLDEVGSNPAPPIHASPPVVSPATGHGDGYDRGEHGGDGRSIR